MGTLKYISRNGEVLVWGDKIYSLEEAREIIRTRAEGWPRRFWPAIFSPNLTDENPNKDLDLWELARKALKYIKAKSPDLEFIFAQHDDTDNPHVQGLMFFKARLEPDEIKWKIRELARGIALGQQEIKKEAGMVIVRLQTMSQFLDIGKELKVSNSIPLVGMAGGRASASQSASQSARRIRKIREPAIPCPNGSNHKVVKWKNKNYCQTCERVLEQSQGLEL